MSYARTLFVIAAAFNLSVAAGLTIGWSFTSDLLDLAQPDGSNRFLIDVTAVLIATFGYAYYMISRDPVRYRSYIVLGLIGKLLVVALAVPELIQGGPAARLAALALGDLLFALLFADFLRRNPHQP